LTVCQRRLGLSEAEDTRLEKYSFFGRQDDLVVLVAERLEGGPVSSQGVRSTECPLECDKSDD